MDVEKAFDRVHHSSLFEALMDFEVDASVVAALYNLYSGLQASVEIWLGVESRRFQVQRGVRQGDPLSPLLFNMVLNKVLADLRPEWRRRKYGTDVGTSVLGERLTHVAFADDMTVVAKSWLSMRRMLSMLRQALALRGLTLHPSKCKAQTNQEEWQRRGDIPVDDDLTVEVLDQDTGLILLGTVLSLTDVS